MNLDAAIISATTRPHVARTRRLLARRYLRPAAWDARVRALVRWAERGAKNQG